MASLLYYFLLQNLCKGALKAQKPGALNDFYDNLKEKRRVPG